MVVKDAADPRDDLEVGEMVEEFFRLSGIDFCNLAMGFTGAEVGEEILHAVFRDEIGEVLHGGVVSEA